MLKSIRGKLIASFVLLIVLISGLSGYSIYNLDISSKGFNSYQDMAQNSLLAGRFQSNIQLSQLNVNEFLNNPNDKDIEAFEQFYKSVLEDISLAKQHIDHPERAELVLQTEAKLREYHQEFSDIQVLVSQAKNLVLTEINANGPKINRLLSDIKKSLVRSGEAELAAQVTDSINNILTAQLYTNKFISSNSRATMNRALREFRGFNRSIKPIQSQLTDAMNQQRLREAQGLIKNYTSAVSELYKVINQKNGHILTMNSLGAQIVELGNSIKLSIQQDQNTIGPEVNNSNQQLITTLISVSILVVLLALVIALTIPKAIITGLESIQQKLLEISETGNFALRADSRREDEIGQMGHVVNQLLESLQTSIVSANEVVNAIADGQFDKRMQIDVNGDLASLKTGVNNSAESVEFMMNELGKVMDALDQGDFSAKMDPRVAKSFRDKVEGSLASIDNTIQAILKVMQKMQSGEFSERVEVDAHGDLLELKTGINDSMAVLQSAVNDLVKVLSAQSQGDLTAKIENSYHGQLNELKQAIHNTSDKLTEVVNGAMTASKVVRNATEEVSRGAMSLSDSLQRQAAAVEQTSATMDEMNAQVSSNSENARSVAGLTDQMQTKANHGVEVMNQTIEAMSQIQESSNKISDIVSLIDSIAFQTNLLALNAAVEAARAGEHGRGFAVVAGEVRNLAQKSADAAKDIKGLIDETVERVNHGSSLATVSGETLGEINESVNSVSAMIEEIATASAEQAEGVGQVHKSVAEVDHVAQQNAALVEQTSAAAESMTEQAEALNQQMSFFNTGDVLMAPVKQEPQIIDETSGEKPTQPEHHDAVREAVQVLPESVTADPEVKQDTPTIKLKTAKEYVKPIQTGADDGQWSEF